MDAIKMNDTSNALSRNQSASLVQRPTEGSPFIRQNEGAGGVAGREDFRRAGVGNEPQGVPAERQGTSVQETEDTREAAGNRSIVARDQDGDTLAVTRQGVQNDDGAVTVMNAADKNADTKTPGRTDEDTAIQGDPNAAAALKEERELAAQQSREARIELNERQKAEREAARQEMLESMAVARERAEAAAAERVEAARQDRNETTENTAQQVDSLIGVTENQLEAYYLEGRISKNDLDKKVEQREENRVADNEAAEKNYQNISVANAALTKASQDADVIANANMTKGNDGLVGTQRVAAADNAAARITNPFENAALETGYEGAGSVNAAEAENTYNVNAANAAVSTIAKQNTDSFLRGEASVQWDYQ